jgi:protein-tyrosine phosphatase
VRENVHMGFAEHEEAPARFRVCFVCTGNICRSPMAEVIMREFAHAASLTPSLAVSSAGTGDWHVGEQADPRTVDALREHGYDGAQHRARQFDPAWFADLDLVIALDRGQERILRGWAPTDDDRAKVALLLAFDREQPALDVPDPYYSDPATFDQVLLMIERACRSLFDQITPALRPASAP